MEEIVPGFRCLFVGVDFTHEYNINVCTMYASLLILLGVMCMRFLLISSFSVDNLFQFFFLGAHSESLYADCFEVSHGLTLRKETILHDFESSIIVPINCRSHDK